MRLGSPASRATLLNERARPKSHIYNKGNIQVYFNKLSINEYPFNRHNHLHLINHFGNKVFLVPLRNILYPKEHYLAKKIVMICQQLQTVLYTVVHISMSSHSDS